MREAHKCTISMSFILDGKEKKLSSSSIKFILIEYLYGKNYMPVIYVSLSINDSLYSDMIENEKKAKFYLNIRGYNVFSNTSIRKDFIKGQFTYKLPTSNPNYSEDLNSQGTNMDSSYKTLALALMSMKLLNKAKTSFNGMLGNIDQNTMIGEALSGLDKVVMKKPKYNAVFETINIPPLPSKSKLLKFIFRKNPFYDTDFMFFMDFNQSYLLDLSGDYCPANDNQLSTVIIDICSVTDSASYSEGISIKNGSYQFYVNPANVNIAPNKIIDNIANQAIFVDDNYIEKVDLNVNRNIDSSTKQSFIRGGHAKLYKNIAESNTVVLELVKDNLDSSIITPNKKFIINSYENHEEYTGLYTLIYKKDIMTNINGEFGFSLSIGLRKVGNITKLGKKYTNSAIKHNTTKVN